MFAVTPKKMIIINILNILKKYSDADHRLSQRDIAEKLKQDYFMEVDRKTVKRNLLDLLELDCGIDYDEIPRTTKQNNKEKDTSLCTGWYIQPEFTDSELRLLIDSLLFSKNIPRTQCKQLIDKLIGLSNIYFNKKVNHVCNLPENQPENKELFYTIDVLEDAISEKKKVSFVYNAYGTDKKLHPRREAEYVVNPYQMVATNGKYYLICNYDKYDTIANYRIDKITNIKILDEKRKPIKDLSEELNLPKHMAEHLYMFAGGSVRVKFKAKKYIIDQVVDWFGTDINIAEISDEEALVEVTVNREAFFCWAMQYALHTEVIEPKEMRERIKEAVKELNKKYNAE